MATPITIYGGHPFYAFTQDIVDDIKGSGFTTVMAWILHVDVDGNLSLNSNPLIKNGQYVGDTSWPTMMASLTQGTTSVNQIGFSMGGAPNGNPYDFTFIKDLINSQGTGPSSVLYQNFSALLKEVPNLNLIDMDDEYTYDQPSMVAFSQMLNGLGLSVTFCPYENTSFWVDCLYELNTQTPGLVKGFNLQAYTTGTNDPGPWITAIADKMGCSMEVAAAMVWPGKEPLHGKNTCNTVGTKPADMQAQYQAWRKASNISGGFVYLYDFIVTCQPTNGYTAANYAQALINGLS